MGIRTFPARQEVHGGIAIFEVMSYWKMQILRGGLFSIGYCGSNEPAVSIVRDFKHYKLR